MLLYFTLQNKISANHNWRRCKKTSLSSNSPDLKLVNYNIMGNIARGSVYVGITVFGFVTYCLEIVDWRLLLLPIAFGCSAIAGSPTLLSLVFFRTNLYVHQHQSRTYGTLNFVHTRPRSMAQTWYGTSSETVEQLWPVLDAIWSSRKSNMQRERETCGANASLRTPRTPCKNHWERL